MTNQTFFNTSMPSSRTADYYLGYMEGCMFLDFNNQGVDKVCLKRISFDGYGCCELSDQSNPLNTVDSEKFKELIQHDINDQETMLTIVKKAIALNIESIWTDALDEYQLT